eukprot:4429768-Prymnesium_polylepis.2
MSEAGVFIIKGSLKMQPLLSSVMRLAHGNACTMFTRAVIEYVYQLDGRQTFQKAVCIAEAGNIFFGASELSFSGVVVAFSCREIHAEHAQDFAPTVAQLFPQDDGGVAFDDASDFMP